MTATAVPAHYRDQTTPLRPQPHLTGPLIATRQHRRFVEFADAVRAHRYIGVCYGPPGVGKTRSARAYSAADDWDHWNSHRYAAAGMPASLLAARTAMWTPYVTTSPRGLEEEIHIRVLGFDGALRKQLDPSYDGDFWPNDGSSEVHLLIVDEADRLRTSGLEQLRDFFDRTDIGLVLIGMPGFERRLARYPQLYSRIGFAHQYRTLDTDDLDTVLAAAWTSLGAQYEPDRPDTIDAAAAITRITGGNYRLIQRLMTQIGRLRELNHLDTITAELVEAARQTLVIGA
ncbi:AAA family ATPase [Nakamurella endophytica]|uniref:ATP-binding protein n=1 Tax=Nakamurella endophytica TaxID=1748367 RepID=A0A917WK60_9ACTN|nr:AAA family ATPase [Nakamurella endophytica]GGM09470.1 ATP-binding protein [Nakamurella endophytica]